MNYKKTKEEFEKIQKDIERNINPIFKNLIIVILMFYFIIYLY